MLNALDSVGNLSKQTLWENAAVYIFWLYEKALFDLISIKRKMITIFYYLRQKVLFLVLDKILYPGLIMKKH